MHRRPLAALVAATALVATPAAASAAPAPAAPHASGAHHPSRPASTGFTDVMAFGSTIKGTPLAQTSPDADSVLTVIKRATNTPEIKQIGVDATGAVVVNHVFEMTADWRDGWTDARIDASSTRDAWATADGTLWHLDRGTLHRVDLPGVTGARGVADVPGPRAHVAARTASGPAVLQVTAAGNGPVRVRSLGNPAGVAAVADELHAVRGHLYARYGAAVHELRGHRWARVATAPAGDVVWLTTADGRQRFVPGTAAASLTGGDVVTDGFVRVSPRGRTTLLTGSTDDGVLVMSGSRHDRAAWAVTRRGTTAYLQRYLG